MESLITDIEIDLLTNKTVATRLIIGDYYLVERYECVHRVRLEKVDETQKRALCFFIDVGEQEWIQMAQIYECDKKYLKFPAQAICMSLLGLEDFNENPHAKQHLDEYLAGKVVIGEIHTKIDEYMAQVKSKDLEPKIQTTLYDTSTKDDIQLNDLILTKICEGTLPPKLERGLNSVSISYIAENGDIFCHLQKSLDSLHYINKLIHQLTGGYTVQKLRSEFSLSSISAVNVKKLYLIFDKSDKKWYRAAILSVNNSDSKTLNCKCIDYGMIKVIEQDNIYELNLLSAALSKFPPQALLVRLHDVNNYDLNVVARLRGLLPRESKVMAKVMSVATVPMVNIFKRMEPTGLFTVNDTIRIEQELVEFAF